MRHDLAGPLCQWAETAAAGSGPCGGAWRLGIRAERWQEICGACSVRVVGLGVEEVGRWRSSQS